LTKTCLSKEGSATESGRSPSLIWILAVRLLRAQIIEHFLDEFADMHRLFGEALPAKLRKIEQVLDDLAHALGTGDNVI